MGWVPQCSLPALSATHPAMSSYPCPTVAGAEIATAHAAFPVTLLRPPPRMLIIEDDENDAILLHRAFESISGDIAMHFVRDGQQAFAYLKGVGHYADHVGFLDDIFWNAFGIRKGGNGLDHLGRCFRSLNSSLEFLLVDLLREYSRNGAKGS